MNPNTRNLIIALVIILLVICLCLIALALGGVFTWLGVRQSTTLPPALEGPAVTVPVAPPLVTALPSASPFPTAAELEPPTLEPTESANEPDEIPDATLQAMMQIEQQVVQLRGLQPDRSEFSRTLLSPQQLRERVENEFFQDYTLDEASRDAVVLSAFGLLEPGFDLISFYTELFSEQIAGYYDDETKEMVVVQGSGFGGPEKITYAHEYVHALQDQNYDLKYGLGFDDELCEQDTERCAALQALLEGDATLVEEGWLVNHATMQDREELLDFYSDLQTPIFERAPAFLQEDFIFPYLQGRIFIMNFWQRNQSESLAALYQNPPVSTEQILHPEKYPGDTPIPVELPDLTAVLGGGWEEIDRNVMGEWYTYLVLARGNDPAARIEDTQANDAAQGWGGDSYLVYQQAESGAVVIVWRQTWDTTEDGSEFFQTFSDYATQRYQTDPQQPDANTSVWETTNAFHQLSLDAATGDTLWVSAPDQELAGQVIEALAAP